MPARVLPNNIEAEESVLGACFLSKYALQKAAESLTPESFYSDKNAKIFSSMLALLEEKTPIDITTITSYMKKNKTLSEVGGVEYLTEVLNFVPTASNIDFYIQNVEEASILRNLISPLSLRASPFTLRTILLPSNSRSSMRRPIVLWYSRNTVTP